jgi:hypothetical protein
MYALKHNVHRSRVGSRVRYMYAWRQVCEVLFAVTPPEVLPFELRKQLLLETVHLLLRKVISFYAKKYIKFNSAYLLKLILFEVCGMHFSSGSLDVRTLQYRTRQLFRLHCFLIYIFSHLKTSDKVN